MGIKYNLSAIEIIKLLGYTEPAGKTTLEQFENENEIKLPSCLFEFLSITFQNPMFATSDIYTDASFYFSHEDIEETIEELEQEVDFNENEEYYEISQLPKEQWEEYVPNHLIIGSDYGAGVVQFGIRTKDLAQDNPPIYMLHEEDNFTEWTLMNDKVSDFLLHIIFDVLTCTNYQTAINVLERNGWKYEEFSDTESAKTQILQKNIDLNAIKQYNFLFYNTDIYYGQCYDTSENVLYIIIKDTIDNYKLYKICK